MQSCKRVPFILALSLVFAASGVAAEKGPPLPLEAYGVWARGSSVSFEEYPFLKGMAYGPRWKDIERQPGVFDWSGLDAAVRKAFEHD